MSGRANSKIRAEIILLLLLMYFKEYEEFQIKLSSIRCQNLDPTFLNISKCITKAVSRSITETTLNVTLLQGPVNNVTVKLKFMKKSTDYNLYYGEQTINICKFLSYRTQYPISNYLFDLLQPYSNANHTCPYEGAIILDRFRIDNNKLTWLPIPTGEFAFFSEWYTDNKLRLDLRFYFSFVE
ncbi:uncharacterized protein LOC119688612 [Teleopsis dalmanni]|uniref:uncharacterized protein LOC119688612 n=1 Tax=Teleopsis dalmanni TaxID=139649 RepID=UPI0018CF669C|nr:uncharacterized protein LOC119688612 [Teleopsis dalmanni]